MAEGDRKARIVLSATDQTAAAFAKAKAGLREVRESAEGAVGVFGSLGLAVAAIFEGASLVNAANLLDELSHLSERSGIAVEQLSALKFAGDIAGNSIEELAKGVRKLADHMASAAGGSRETAVAFEAIGVSVLSTSGGLKSTDEVLLQIADKFRGYKDGAEKSALATALFGKAGESLIPLLNLGSSGIEEQTRLAKQLGAVYSGELAKGAQDFNDNLKRLALAAEGGKVAILEKLLPGLNLMAAQFVENAKNAGLFTSALITLKNALAFDFGLDKLGGLQRDAATTSGEIARLTNVLIGVDNVLQREPGNEAAQRRAGVLRGKLKELQDQAVKTGEAIRQEIDFVNPDKSEAARLLSRSNANRKAAPIVDKTGGVAKDEGLAQFNELLDRLKQRQQADTQQLALNRDLTESEKFALDIETKLTGAKSKLSSVQQDQLRIVLQQVKGLDQELETRKLLRDARDADAKAETEMLANLENAVQARADENRGLLDQIRLFGLTARELEAVKIQRLEINKIFEEGAIQTAAANGAGDGELLLMREQINLLGTQIKLRKQAAQQANSAEDDPLQGAQRALKAFRENLTKGGLEAERQVNEVLKQLEDGITGALTGKQVDARALVDNIIQEFLRLKVVKPLLADIFGEGSSGSGLLTTLLGAFSGKAAGGPVQAGMPHMVGERGRELFIPQTAGTIVPNSALGSGQPTIIINSPLSVGQGVSIAQVAAALQISNSQLKADILRSKRRAGVFE